MRTITSGRLILRPWDAEDVDFLLDMPSAQRIGSSSRASPRENSSAVATDARHPER